MTQQAVSITQTTTAPAASQSEAPPAQAVAASSQAPASIDDAFAAQLIKDQGCGFENVAAQDLNIPVITLLQDMSPQVREAHEKYVEGAKSGMIFISSSKMLLPMESGVDFIPVFWEETYTEWIPNQGGFVTQHGPAIRQSASYVENKGLLLPNGNELLISSVFYVLLKQGGFYSPAVIRLGKSMHRVGKDILTRMKSMRYAPENGKAIDNMPMSSMMVHLDVATKQDGDNIWHVWKDGAINFLWDRTDLAMDAMELYSQAKALGEQFKSGSLNDKIDNEEPVSQAAPATQAAPPIEEPPVPQSAEPAVESDEIPY